MMTRYAHLCEKVVQLNAPVNPSKFSFLPGWIDHDVVANGSSADQCKFLDEDVSKHLLQSFRIHEVYFAQEVCHSVRVFVFSCSLKHGDPSEKASLNSSDVSSVHCI